MDPFEGRVVGQSHFDAAGTQNEFRLGYSFSRWEQARDMEGGWHLECVAGRDSVNSWPKISALNSWLSSALPHLPSPQMWFWRSTDNSLGVWSATLTLGLFQVCPLFRRNR